MQKLGYIFPPIHLSERNRIKLEEYIDRIGKVAIQYGMKGAFFNVELFF